MTTSTSRAAPAAGLDVVGSRKDIPHLVEKHDIGVIVFAIHNIDPQEREEILELCAATPARIVHVPDLGAMVGEIVNGRGGRR
jgi:FlaA1/EpsC-like NDP-sugar epimerase